VQCHKSVIVLRSNQSKNEQDKSNLDLLFKISRAASAVREVIQVLHKTVCTQNFGFLRSIRQSFRDVLVVAKETSGREGKPFRYVSQLGPVEQ
jgi:hypothetical protein